MSDTMRKIDAMHYFYGTGVGICGNCPHFTRKEWGNVYRKCLVYGDSNSEATDWRTGYPACGLIDKPFPEEDVRIVKLIGKLNRTDKTDEPLEGQIRMEV